MNRVILGPEYFPSPTIGLPISGAQIFVGEPDKLPQDFPIQLSVLQEDKTVVPVAQPILTGAGGIPLYNGSPVTLIVDDDYSLQVLDSNNTQVYYVPRQAAVSSGVVAYGDGTVEEALDTTYAFDTVALMVAATWLSVGMRVKTLGYYVVGDSGDNYYQIVAAGTGSVDGGSFIDLATFQAQGIFPKGTVNAVQFGAKGDGATDNTSMITAAKDIQNLIDLPFAGLAYNMVAPTLNTETTLLGQKLAAINSATSLEDLKALLISGGYIGGVPIASELRNEKVEVICGTIQQNATTRTNWDWIKDANHEPVGVDDSTPAIASTSQITIPFLKTYSKVLGFVCGPDESLANGFQFTCGASVGLSTAVIQASASLQASAEVFWDGAAWQVSEGVSSLNFSVNVGSTSTNVVIDHDYCPGISYNINAYTQGGTITPFIPVIKSQSDTQLGMSFQDAATGALYIGGSFTTAMSFTVEKQYHDGILLDGSTTVRGDSSTMDLSVGNIWFIGLFQV